MEAESEVMYVRTSLHCSICQNDSRVVYETGD